MAALALIFLACASPPPLAQQFNLTSLSSGLLHPAANASLCVAPVACGTDTRVVAAACASVNACAPWSYDTFTYFTLTNDASGQLLTDAGAGADAAVSAAAGTSAQQFVYSQQQLTLQPAADPSLCLTLAAAAAAAAPTLGRGSGSGGSGAHSGRGNGDSGSAAGTRTVGAHPSDPPPQHGRFVVNASARRQVILGLGFEIQSDSIGSGNRGLPDANTSVPLDLTPSERARFYMEMLGGFRFCRLALGLYFRGLTPDNSSIVERWPGQAALLAEMAAASGLEGFAVEYWSPAPAWKSTGAYTGGGLASTAPDFLDAFGAAVAADAQYLAANGIKPVWWGLQNEPAVGPNGCIYSCCGMNGSTYHLAFAAAATHVRASFPDTVIHASSWSGQHWSPQLLADPAALALVDAWTVHDVGGDANDQISRAAYYLNNSKGRPVLNNEFEYLDSHTNGNRTMNTVASILNWFVFESAPSWYWLHALKPLGHAEAAGYGLGYWNPVLDPAPGSLPPGHWEYNADNSNALAGFLRYMPWDAVRVDVAEDAVLGDQRVLAYLFDPARARWLLPPGAQPPPAAQSSRHTLRDGAAARAAATHLGVVLCNRYFEHAFTSTLALVWDAAAPAPVFDGWGFSGASANVALGTRTAVRNATSGLFELSVDTPPLTAAFWVQRV